jgi:hypothetical protein
VVGPGLGIDPRVPQKRSRNDIEAIGRKPEKPSAISHQQLDG